ncbi:putative methyltransferase TARBP1 [Amphibalanus amphitrite]|uniref:tRNA (guanosine(18)-2'-O)-methyltransferase TARBP1 n=1 Tax=Amphibalanus amphitrite TaxID=1232801 RepID=A0A6A4W7D4_AMPAM|nr:putative methyltransferase TARBP1 [Amphibalanus amphitrite]
MPQMVSVLSTIQESEGEYTAGAISECTISILEKCLLLCDCDKLKTELLERAVAVLSAVFVCSDGSYASEPWSRGLRCVSRLAAAAVSSLSDVSLQPHLPALAAVLFGLVSSARPAAALAGVATLGPLLLSRPEFRAAHAAQLWTLLRPADAADLARCLAAACAMADHLLSPPPELLWPLLGAGLTADDPLQRKRARYLLQRAVETRRAAGEDTQCRWLPWSSASARRAAPLWDDLALLLETLEGKQVHLIRPVMAKLDTLLVNTELVPLFWSLCVLRRAFGHGNAFVVRWGVLRALRLPHVDEIETFVTSALIPALNDAALFADVDLHAVLSSWEPAEAGCEYQCDSMPPPTETGGQLRTFLCAYLSGDALERRAAALTDAVAGQSWSSVALLHVAHALAAVPAGRCLDAAPALTLCRSLSERLAAQEAAEVMAALAAERSPVRGRLLGGALRILETTLPLTADHPVLPPLHAALVECHTDLYRPRNAVVSDMALLAGLVGKPDDDKQAPSAAVRQLIGVVIPCVGEYIVRQVEAAATAEDLTLCEFYAELLRAAAAVGWRVAVETVVHRLCGVATSAHPLRVHASVVTLAGVAGALVSAVTSTNLGPELLREAATAAWTALHEHRRSEVFVLSLPGLSRLVFTADTLTNPDLADLVQDMSERLLQLAESVPAALLALISQLNSVWSTDSSSLPRHLPTVTAALLHGAVHRRDRRALQDTVGFVSGPAAPSTADHLLDKAIRAAGVAALGLLMKRGPAAAVAELAEELRGRADRAGEGRHFGNSASHRVQQRAYQALLVLHTALSPDEREKLCISTCDRLLRCHPQPSVRYLQEWLVVLLCLRQVLLIAHVWDHMDKAALHRLWLLAEKRAMSAILSEFEVVHASVSQSLEYGNANKNSQLILNDFYFTVFDPVRHFSLEAIYCSLPRLASVEQDEWVPPELFPDHLTDGAGDGEQPQAGPLRLSRLCPGLRDAQPASWTARTGDLRMPPAGEVAGAVDADPSSTGGGEVQRKPTPWRQLLPEPSEVSAVRRGRRPAGAGPVLVAALVDRAPNLGGLCRTCEVLGASRMVISSLQLTADKQFQSLSVSAERWVPLTEVKPHQLAEYLSQLRSAGYTLVGVEQTSNSVPVTAYQFPERTALVLGNEREGIPVELIHLLDVCVEIPQCGVVRSLNVHVAGALLLWEYRRQHP